jgi:hypothetical protein
VIALPQVHSLKTVITSITELISHQRYYNHIICTLLIQYEIINGFTFVAHILLLEKWGGISSEEHDEAVMLEAAMFGGIPEAPTYPLSIPSHASSSHYPQVVHSPPPELTEQRLLREQQVRI